MRLTGRDAALGTGPSFGTLPRKLEGSPIVEANVTTPPLYVIVRLWVHRGLAAEFEGLRAQSVACHGPLREGLGRKRERSASGYVAGAARSGNI